MDVLSVLGWEAFLSRSRYHLQIPLVRAAVLPAGRGTNTFLGRVARIKMKRSAVICLVLGAVFLVTAIFSHFYMTTSTGLLPVISYPLRPYTIPFASTGAVLAALGIYLQVRR